MVRGLRGGEGCEVERRDEVEGGGEVGLSVGVDGVWVVIWHGFGLGRICAGVV